ncbi:MAG: epoxyqueuosine reductase [Anaerolineae bacterium]
MEGSEGLRGFIEGIVRGEVTGAQTVTHYRKPLVGFARAEDEGFHRLRTETLAKEHLLPQDLLPGAKSVLAFFLPFEESVVRANREHEYTAPEWALAYVETNALIARICAVLKEELASRGIRAAAEPPTHNFDPVELVSRWSHKSVAYLAGLGRFGLHHMLITEAGCAGRFGSLVMDVEIEPTPRPEREFCLYYLDGSCLYCVENCPVGALTEKGLNRALCYERCLEVDRFYSDLGLTDCCGKCAIGPCALAPA